jgi:hypothetical protein
MKIKLDNGYYITDEGTDGHKKVKLDFLWIGSDDDFIGTVDTDYALKKLQQAIKDILKNKSGNARQHARRA